MRDPAKEYHDRHPFERCPADNGGNPLPSSCVTRLEQPPNSHWSGEHLRSSTNSNRIPDQTSSPAEPQTPGGEANRDRCHCDDDDYGTTQPSPKGQYARYLTPPFAAALARAPQDHPTSNEYLYQNPCRRTSNCRMNSSSSAALFRLGTAYHYLTVLRFVKPRGHTATTR